MTDRSYTVKEITALRRVCINKALWGWYNVIGFSGRRAGKSAARAAAEEMVRTHMLAGHTAEDLIASEEE